MNRDTFNVLRNLWRWHQRNKDKRMALYDEIFTHFQSKEVNMLHNLGYLVRCADGVEPTDKVKRMNGEDLYSINILK